MRRFLERGPWLPAALFAWTWIATGTGYLLGNRFLLPILQVLPAYAAMLLLLRGGHRRRAVAVMLIWAAGVGIAGTTAAALLPATGEAVVLNGASYRDEMFGWLRTGAGPEGEPARFLPLHLRDLTVFLLLAAGTASLLAMTMGAVLMNYMSFYVGSLFLHAESSAGIALFGWPLYSVIRVASYVILGVVLAEPLLSRLAPYHFRWRDLRPWIAAAAAGLLLDVTIKAFAASFWRRSLLDALGTAFGTG